MSLKYTLEFEETLPGFDVSGIPGEATPVFILNESAMEGMPDRVIKNTQSWSVAFKWRISGVTADVIGPGTWNIRAHLDRLSSGGGALMAGASSFAYKTAAGPDDYDQTITIAAGSVPDGVYKLYVVVSLDTAATVPVTFFGEGPVMRFYTPT